MLKALGFLKFKAVRAVRVLRVRGAVEEPSSR